MNKIFFDVTRRHTFDSGYEASTVNIQVDEKPLAELMRAYELPMATNEGHPELAGAYAAIKTASASLEQYYLGKTGADWGIDQDKTLLLGCACGVAGCWPLLCKIDVGDDTVTWSGFEQPHRDEDWDYSEFAGFVFEKQQYLDAIAAMMDI